MSPARVRGDARVPETGDREGQGNRLCRWLGIALIVAGVVLLVVRVGLEVRRVRTCADSTLTRLRALQSLASQGTAAPADLELEAAGAHLHGLQEDLACLRSGVGVFLPLAPLFGWLPEVGPDVASAPALFDMAQALADAGVLIFDGLSPLVAQVQPGVSSSSPPQDGGLDLAEALAVLESAQPALAAADSRLQVARNLHQGLRSEELSPRLGRFLEVADRSLPMLHTGVKAAQIAPELLGAEGKRTYLILAQNDDERRPTGGWISGMGLLTITGGQVEEIRFQDSWSVDNLAVPHDIPPESMLRVLWAEMWLFRDANWSPDFPRSAQVAERILERDRGISVDGVIAVDQQMLQLLVAAMEPLVVESSAEPVTGANVLRFIRDSWTEPEEGVRLSEGWAEWTVHRKDFMPALVNAMMDRVQTQPHGLDLSRLGKALWQGLQGRHLLVYLHHAEAAQLLALQKWDGAILELPGDYLQVVDANVGFNKVDPNVQRAITYAVDLTKPAQARAEAVVHYRNGSQREVVTCEQGIEWLPSYDQRMHGCYWDYVRFLAPQGSRLLTLEREPLPSGSLLNRYRFAPPEDGGPHVATAERNKVAFGLFFALPPGEQRNVALAWQLPAGIVQDEAGGWRYQLHLQKQSGSQPIPLRVIVSLPPGSRLMDAIPAPTTLQAEQVIFDLSLATDQYVQVAFQESQAGER